MSIFIDISLSNTMLFINRDRWSITKALCIAQMMTHTAVKCECGKPRPLHCVLTYEGGGKWGQRVHFLRALAVSANG